MTDRVLSRGPVRFFRRPRAAQDRCSRSSNRCTAVAELVEQQVAYDDQVYRQNVQRRAVHGVCSPLLDDVKLVTLKCEGVVGIRLRHSDFAVNCRGSMLWKARGSIWLIRSTVLGVAIALACEKRFLICERTMDVAAPRRPYSPRPQRGDRWVARPGGQA